MHTKCEVSMSNSVPGGALCTDANTDTNDNDVG